MQIGNLQAVAQFLCNFSKSVSGTMADILSPARMVIFGTLLTTLNKPMFALSGWVFASFGTVATLYWITAGMKRRQSPENNFDTTLTSRVQLTLDASCISSSSSCTNKILLTTMIQRKALQIIQLITGNRKLVNQSKRDVPAQACT